jgi:serine/threonine protein kinase
MNPESWERVKELFERGLDETAAARENLLDSAGAGVDEHNWVARLWSEHDRAGRFLETSILSLTNGMTVDSTGQADAAAELSEGAVLLERYLVLRQLGRGGNGIAYLAEDRQLSGKKVVIKMLYRPGRQGASWAAGFRREMEALARIDHPGVVQVLDFSDGDGTQPFLVMQYVDGVTLRTELKAGRFSLERAAAILAQIGDALDAVHRSGVAHHDLKPENIMIQKSPNGAEIVRLIDFGIAKVEESKINDCTTSLMLVGTTRYMAPEQVLGKAGYTSDIYALGLVAYEVLTGCCPYMPESAFELLDMQLDLRFMRPRKLRPDLPRKAERLIVKALGFQASSRPQAVGVFGRSLAAALRSRRVLSGAAAAVLMVGLVLTGVRFLPSRLWPSAPTPLIRTIDVRNSVSPIAEGFDGSPDVSNELTGAVAFNLTNSGYDGWRVTTHSQGFYVKKLDAPQTAAALAHGWRMSAVLRAEVGGAFVIASFREVHRRYDIFTFLDENGDTTVRLITKLLPDLTGPEYHLKGSGTGFHKLELVYEARSKTAALLVDGVERISGYNGHSEYTDNSWFVFGPHLYRTQQAVATFQTLHFEINP